MKGILFKPDMIKAIVGGRKTQTRRVIKPQPLTPEMNRIWRWKLLEFIKVDFDKLMPMYARYQVGDVVYIKEAWHLVSMKYPEWAEVVVGGELKKVAWNEWLTNHRYDKDWYKYRQPMLMPAWVARYFIKIKDVRAERLQDITLEDIYDEGIDVIPRLWDSINKPPYDWNSNCWMWVYSFQTL